MPLYSFCRMHNSYHWQAGQKSFFPEIRFTRDAPDVTSLPGPRTTLLIFRETFVEPCCLWVAILIPSSVTHWYHSTLAATHRPLLAFHPSWVLEGGVEQVIVHEEGILRVVKDQVSQRLVYQEWLSKPVPMLTFVDLAVLNLFVAPAWRKKLGYRKLSNTDFSLQQLFLSSKNRYMAL